MATTDVRRAPRFKVMLRVQVTGIDRAPVLRSGDISASGLFLELDRDVGTVGSIQRLVLSEDADTGPGLVTLARVVRVATIDDYWKGCTVAGVAFQFLFIEEPGMDGPTSRPAAGSEPLKQLLRRVVEAHARTQGLAVNQWRGRMQTRGGEQAAAVSGLNPRSMTIETDYRVPPGETIRVEMPGRGTEHRLSVDGEVIDCHELAVGSEAARFRLTVAFRSIQDSDAPPRTAAVSGESMDDAFASFMDALSSLAPPEPAPRPHVRHLAGELSRISLLSLLTLCQMERVTGLVLLTNGTSRTRAYLHEGELVDAAIDGREVSPRSALQEVVAWREGHFEVVEDSVQRPNRFGLSTTMLLIDLAREYDEAGRV